jgi:hypothetical protein
MEVENDFKKLTILFRLFDWNGQRLKKNTSNHNSKVLITKGWLSAPLHYTVARKTVQFAVYKI